MPVKFKCIRSTVFSPRVSDNRDVGKTLASLAFNISDIRQVTGQPWHTFNFTLYTDIHKVIQIFKLTDNEENKYKFNP
jgi:hypothetical protein